MSKTISDQLVQILVDSGLAYGCGVPGDAIDLVLAAIHRRTDFKFYLARHEEGAGFMVSARTKLTGEMGVVFACQGPGSAHLLEAMYDAKMDKIPMLVITGQIESALIGTNTVQEINQLLLFEDVACFNREVRSANNLVDIIQLAIQAARVQRGVAHVSIATDVLRQAATQRLPSKGVYDIPYALIPTEPVIQKAVDLLNAHANVTILYGGGTLLAREELLQVATLLSAPMVHTVRSKDIIDNQHPHYIGGIGFKGSKNGCDFVKHCDALLIVGCSFAWREFYPENVPIVQIDTDPLRIGVRCSVTVGLLGDAKLTLALLAQKLTQKTNNRFLKKAQVAHQHALSEMEKQVTKTNTKQVIDSNIFTFLLGKHLKEEAIVTVDAGTISVWANNWLRLNGRQRLIASTELGTLGYGMPAAIGCQMAKPDSQVVALCGDGGFHMTMGDFATAMKYQLPIKVVIYNNFAYHFIELEQLKEGIAECYTKLTNPDYAKLAESFGAEGYTIKHYDEIEPVLSVALNSPNPCIINVFVNPNELIMPSKVTFAMAFDFMKGVIKTKFTSVNA